jgi:hypothetical protein
VNGPFRGDDLAAWDRDEGFARFVSERAYGRFDPDHRLVCPFPSDHPGHSARLWLDKRGRYVVADRHHGSSRRSYVLAEVYAATIDGRLERLSRGSMARWKVRALAAFGVVALPSVPTPDMPSATAEEVAFISGLVLLLVVRAVTEPLGASLPITSGFMARWCAMDVDAADRGKAGLLKRGLLADAGKEGQLRLWRPTWLAERPHEDVDDDENIEF